MAAGMVFTIEPCLSEGDRLYQTSDVNCVGSSFTYIFSPPMAVWALRHGGGGPFNFFTNFLLVFKFVRKESVFKIVYSKHCQSLTMTENTCKKRNVLERF